MFDVLLQLSETNTYFKRSLISPRTRAKARGVPTHAGTKYKRAG